MENDQLHAGFTRNRRFLIAASLTLACMTVLGLKFTKISAFGNEATIEHAEHVTQLAWVIWAFSYLQYLVWFRDIDAWGMFQRAVNADCELELGTLVARERIPDDVMRNLLQNLIPTLPNMPDTIEAARADGRIRHLATYARMHGDGKTRERAADIEAIMWSRLPNQAGEASVGPIRFEREITDAEWGKHWWRAFLKVFFTRRFTLEYFMPFVIGLLPLAVYWHTANVRPAVPVPWRTSAPTIHIAPTVR